MPENALLPSVADAVARFGLDVEVLDCDPALADTAAFCAAYGFDEADSANTILVASRKVDPVRIAVCVVLATTRLDVNRAVTRLLDVKRASFADAETTVALTGMEIGGVTAIGVDEALPVYVDAAVLERDRVVMGGGNRSTKLVLAPSELTKLPTVQIVEGLAAPKA